MRESLTEHEISTAYERGWSTLKNGELLDAAEGEGFEVLVTTDNNLKYHQNLVGRRIAIVVLTRFTEEYASKPDRSVTITDRG